MNINDPAAVMSGAAIASPCLSLRSAAAGGGAQSSPDPRPGNISRVRRDLSPCPVSAVRHEAAARPDPPGPGPHNQRVSFCCHRLREKNFTIYDTTDYLEGEEGWVAGQNIL